VADGDCGIGFFQEIRNRFADYIASSENDSSFTPNLDFGFFEKDHDSLWSARNKIWFSTSFGELSNIDSLETIDVFEWGNS
jgi:hypothetical protein